MRKFLLSAVALSALAGAPALAQDTNAADKANTADANASSNIGAANSNGASSNPNATPAPATTMQTPGQNGNGLNPPANAPSQTTAQDVPGKGPNFIQPQSEEMLSSNVVGLDVYNEHNDNIGKIQDVVMDPARKVTGYVLSVGGFLGLGTRYVAVDPDSVNIKYDQNNKSWRAAMNATKDQLKNAPEFRYGGQWTASRS